MEYNSLSLNNTLVSLDSILARWKQDRYLVTKKFDKNKNHLSPFEDFPSQQYCLYSMNKYSSSKKNCCILCKVLSNISKDGEISDIIKLPEFTLKISKPKRELCFYEQIENSNYILWRANPGSYGHSDHISCMLENEIGKSSIKTFFSFQWLGKCNDDLIVVNRTTDFKPKFDSETVLGIISQLVAICHFLKSFLYTHGDPDSKYIEYLEEPVAYIYEGVKISSPIKISIKPSPHTAISFVNKEDKFIRICQQTAREKITPDYIVKDNKYYISEETYIEQVRKAGKPIIYGYNLCGFIASLATDPEFRSAMFSSPKSTKIWDYLFETKEYPTDSVADFLYRRGIKFDSLQESLSILK